MKSPIFLPWLITGTVVALISIGVAFAHYSGTQWQQPIIEESRIFWRTLFYILAIVILPLTNLLRHVFLRLNQTMPLLLAANLKHVVQARYALTIGVSMLAMLTIGCLGIWMFYLGDGFNTLHILTGVAGLGVFLYRPKLHEYQQISDSLTTLTESPNE